MLNENLQNCCFIYIHVHFLFKASLTAMIVQTKENEMALVNIFVVDYINA